VVRVENGKLAEHWGAWEKEATRAESASGLRMFGDHFPDDGAVIPFDCGRVAV
jgi:hypothetical protein